MEIPLNWIEINMNKNYTEPDAGDNSADREIVTEEGI